MMVEEKKLTNRMSLHKGTSTLMVEGRKNTGAGNLNKMEFEFGAF